MNCHDVQMQLSEFLEKSLDAIRTKSIETHLISCPACRAEANSLSDCIRQVADLPIIEPPAGFARRVMAHAREIEIEPRGWQRFIAAFRVTMPIQAAAVVMIAVLAVLLYQKETKITESGPAQLTALPPALPLSAQGQPNAVVDSARSSAPSRPSSPPDTQRKIRRAPVAEQDRAQARQQQVPDTSLKDQVAAASAETEKPLEGRIAAPRRPTIQAQEVATGRGSFRPSTHAFDFGAAIGALSQTPFRNAPFAAAERAASPLSEPRADIEFIVRRRSFERREQGEEKEESSGDTRRKRSEADAAIAAAAVNRAVPAPASPASSIVEMRWFAVPAARFEQFRKDLAAEAHIDSERSIGSMDKEFASQSSRELLIKVIILPSER
ncbi:MAG: anti-sigma factor family protein [Candidatus Binatia bacterium]